MSNILLKEWMLEDLVDNENITLTMYIRYWLSVKMGFSLTTTTINSIELRKAEVSGDILYYVFVSDTVICVSNNDRFNGLFSKMDSHLRIGYRNDLINKIIDSK